MITPFMSFKEAYDHLAEDLEKVKYRRNYYLPKAIKDFHMARKFPVWKCYRYTVPQSNNTYVVYFYAENYSCIENPKEGSFLDYHMDNERYVVKWGASGYRHTNNSEFKALRILHFYSSHFLQRYNERFLKNDSLTSTDIACQYLSRNEIAMQIEIDKDINKNIEKYDEGAKTGFYVRDGFCFTNTQLEGLFGKDDNRENDRVDAMLIQYKTFVNESMLTEGQHNAIMKEYCERWSRSYLNFIKESKDGVLALKLDP